jgi:hypothetical protein
LFLSARLMQRLQDHRDPHVISDFDKLATVLPSPIAQHVPATVAWLNELPSDDPRARSFDLIAAAHVRLRFLDASATQRVLETNWHPSQHVSHVPDSSLQMTLDVGGLLEISPWVLGWGSAVEVLDPPGLCRSIGESPAQWRRDIARESPGSHRPLGGRPDPSAQVHVSSL